MADSRRGGGGGVALDREAGLRAGAFLIADFEALEFRGVDAFDAVFFFGAAFLDAALLDAGFLEPEFRECCVVATVATTVTAATRTGVAPVAATNQRRPTSNARSAKARHAAKQDAHTNECSPIASYNECGATSTTAGFALK